MGGLGAGYRTTKTSGPTNIYAVTKSDDDNLPYAAKCLWVGAAGDVAIHDWNDNPVVIPNVTAGCWHAIPCRRVLDSGTEASEIIAGYDT